MTPSNAGNSPPLLHPMGCSPGPGHNRNFAVSPQESPIVFLIPHTSWRLWSRTPFCFQFVYELGVFGYKTESNSGKLEQKNGCIGEILDQVKVKLNNQV